MPLPSPILDDRTYQQLSAELKARIPVYTPEWTDHNESDPGITLLELFAFQAEGLLYRFNQVPEATYLEFLRLLRVPLRPAQAAVALLLMSTQAPGGVAVAAGSVATAGKLELETLDEATVWPVSSIALARTLAEPPSAADDPEVHELVLRTLDALPPALAELPRVYYHSEVLDPAAAEPAAVDFGAAVDGTIWIALLAEKGFDRAAWTRCDRPAALLNVGFEPDLPAAGLADAAPCAGGDGAASAPLLEWQILTARPLRDGQPQYARLRVAGDTTRGLTQAGVVRIELPRAAEDIGTLDVDPDLAGAGDLPPRLDDALAERLVTWVRVFRRDGSRFGRFRLIAVNAARAEQARRAPPQFLGTGDGQPAQAYALAQRPVLDDGTPAAVTVEVEEAGRWVPYGRVEDFFGSGRDSRHFVLDAEQGSVCFGDGLRGRMPQWGERIRARGWRYGGGAAGNVPAGAIDRLRVPGVKVRNPLRATGGADAESIEGALRRIPEELRRRGRAVTAGDFRELALQTPGVGLGRAECLPRFHPPTRTLPAAGVVTVMVWPAEDPRHPDAPLPDAATLRAVCEWLDRLRLVTTELYVVGPVYRRVAVSVALQVKDGYGVEAVRRWVELVIRQYLAPLPPYGPAGQGWPLGRRVHGPELEAAALQVEGVEYLEGLAVAGWDEGAGRWSPGTVELRPWEVPELAAVTVVDGLPLPGPGEGVAPAAAPLALPVPILRDRC